MKQSLSALFVFIFILIIGWSGAGYRPLSQDETETAERGRTTWESGIPRVIDKAGRLSVFAGGRELEEGVVHRYTPWVQFYAAAAGVKLKRITGINQDKAVRTPFIVAHALVSGLICYGLLSVAPVPAAVGVAYSILCGVQTDRLLHNRTARYHPLMDLLAVLALLGLAALRKGTKGASLWVAAVIFLLPQTHTMTGSLMSLLVGVLAGGVIFAEPHFEGRRLRTLFWTAIVPGVATLAVLLGLVRPWAQSEWGGNYPFGLMHSYSIHRRFVYAYLVMGLAGLFLFLRKRRWEGISLMITFILLLLICPNLDRNVNAQFRYYLPLWLFAMLWPLGYGARDWSRATWTAILSGMFILILLPEFSTRRYHPYHGLELALDDARKERAGVKQPLHELLDILRTKGKPGDAVLFDSVPMYATWYFPDRTAALMPDETQRRPLNQNNPVWQKPLVMPDWYAWYPNWMSGVAAILKSDYAAHDLDMKKGTFKLTSKKAGQTVSMCVDRVWRTNMFNNNPVHLYDEESLLPSGGTVDIMLLSHRCDHPDPMLK